jgi:hypothetical protein
MADGDIHLDGPMTMMQQPVVEPGRPSPAVEELSGQVGTGTMRARRSLPTTSTMTERPSRCWRWAEIRLVNSSRRRPEPLSRRRDLSAPKVFGGASSPRGLRPAKHWLLGDEQIVLATLGVPLVARDPPEVPHAIDRERGRAALNDREPRHWRERFPDDGLEALDSPITGSTTREGNQQWRRHR